jgi:hypothetical protein
MERDLETDWSALRSELQQAQHVRPLHGISNEQGAHTHRLWSDGVFLPVTDLAPSQHFDKTLRRRRSSRVLNATSLDQLGVVAARAGLTRTGARTERGNDVLSRPSPSAGARHPLSLAIVLSAAAGPDRAKARSWVLDPDFAVLRPGIHTQQSIDGALRALADALGMGRPPPAAIMIVARPCRTLTCYPTGMSLLWREAGALMMLIHLAATDLGLSSCLAGTCAVLHPIAETACAPVDLGAVAIGASEPEATSPQ